MGTKTETQDRADPNPKRDSRWQSIFDNVPSDFLLNLAKTRKDYKLENLTKGQEALVDEIFRVCDQKTLDSLYEQFLGTDGAIWYYAPTGTITKEALFDAIGHHISSELLAGIEPALGHEPSLYRVEKRHSVFVFCFAARDSIQHIRTGLGERTTVEGLSLYTAVLHFSSPRMAIMGPYTTERANAVAAKLQDSLKSDVAWECVKPKRGERRKFYDSMKAALNANLIETKRYDPSGDYETVALEARSKHPDLEDVSSFREQYLNADSVYDVLEFRVANPVGIDETTHVKFGSPFGRFSFRTRTSLAAIYHFEKSLYGVLR